MSHAGVMVGQLEASLAFYRDRLGLIPSTHTQPETPQDGAAFGLDTAQWDARAAAIVHAELKRGVSSLATIGSTAPFVGLFGTVLGIINALWMHPIMDLTFDFINLVLTPLKLLLN